MIDSLVDYLEEQGIGEVGAEIYIGELPFDKTDIISLVTSPSPDPNKAIPYYTQMVDVRARFTNYDEGYQKLQDILDLLHQKENYSIEGYHIYLSYAAGMINDNDRDIERRHLFSLTLGFVYRRASVLS